MLGALLTAALVTAGWSVISAPLISLALKDSPKERRRNVIIGVAFLAFFWSLFVYTITSVVR